MKRGISLVRLFLLGSVFLGGGGAQAAETASLGTVFFHALWQFEGGVPLAVGVEVQNGEWRLKRCAADFKRGAHGEVSRFQILPSVWRNHRSGVDYTDPGVAWTTTHRILQERVEWFRRSVGREPTGFDLYVMWNAPGHYAAVRFVRGRLRPEVRERGERFANFLSQHEVEMAVKTAQR